MTIIRILITFASFISFISCKEVTKKNSLFTEKATVSKEKVPINKLSERVTLKV